MKTVYVLALLVAFLLGSNVHSSVPLKTESENGRFQLFLNPEVRADFFLLDTATGKVWQRTTLTDVEGKPDVWEFQDRIDSDEAMFQYVGNHKIIKEQK